MDFINVQIPSRDECRSRNLCLKCGIPNHCSATCNNRQTRTDKANNCSRRNYQQRLNRQHVNNMDSREDEKITNVYGRVTINVVEVKRKSE